MGACLRGDEKSETPAPPARQEDSFSSCATTKRHLGDSDSEEGSTRRRSRRFKQDGNGFGPVLQMRPERAFSKRLSSEQACEAKLRWQKGAVHTQAWNMERERRAGS